MIKYANQGEVECWRCPRCVTGVTLKQWVGSLSSLNSLNSSQSLKITITLRGGRRYSTTAQQCCGDVGFRRVNCQYSHITLSAEFDI